MSELGDLLELVMGARTSYRTLRGTVREWAHLERSHEAFRRMATAHGGAIWTNLADSASDDDPVAPPEFAESTTRLWLGAPDRVRCETERDPAAGTSEALLVIDGTRWWAYSDEMGAITNGGDPHQRHAVPIRPEMLDPERAFFGRQVTIGAPVVVAGRDGIAVHLSPRPESRALPGDDAILLMDRPEEQDLVLDRERGVVLRQTSLLDGVPYAVTEFTEIAFDEDLHPDLFVFAAPAGVTLTMPTPIPSADEVPLLEAAAAMSFRVFAATDLPEGWHVACFVRGGPPDVDLAVTVHLHYMAGDASAHIHVTQHGPAGAETTPDGRAWRSVPLDGVDYGVWEPSEADRPMQRQVFAKREGTVIRLSSAEVPHDELIAFAASLRPVP